MMLNVVLVVVVMVIQEAKSELNINSIFSSDTSAANRQPRRVTDSHFGSVRISSRSASTRMARS